MLTFDSDAKLRTFLGFEFQIAFYKRDIILSSSSQTVCFMANSSHRATDNLLLTFKEGKINMIPSSHNM